MMSDTVYFKPLNTKMKTILLIAFTVLIVSATSANIKFKKNKKFTSIGS